MLSHAFAIFLLAGIGWDAPPACPTKESFLRLVEDRLGGEDPGHYSVDVDAWVNEFAHGRYELALHATHSEDGVGVEFATVDSDCMELTNFAAAWAATQIDPLGLGPPPTVETSADSSAVPVELGFIPPTKPAITEPEADEPQPTIPEPAPSRRGPSKFNALVGVSVGGAFAFSSPIVTALNSRVGLKWRSLQVSVAGHGFIDSAMSNVKPSILRPTLMAAWSAGPELCWAPSVGRLLLWGCTHVDGGAFHLVTDYPEIDEPLRAPWVRMGVSAAVGFETDAGLQPFLSLGFSQVVSDIRVVVDGESILDPIGTFAFVSIGGNFIIRKKRAAT